MQRWDAVRSSQNFVEKTLCKSTFRLVSLVPEAMANVLYKLQSTKLGLHDAAVRWIAWVDTAGGPRFSRHAGPYLPGYSRMHHQCYLIPRG